MWGELDADKAAALSGLPMRVLYDNMTSDRATILQIFAQNRPGLLYQVARALYEMELSVIAAKIGTYLDQVVDVFYVTDAGGNKIHDESRLNSIRQRIVDVIESLQSQAQSAE